MEKTSIIYRLKKYFFFISIIFVVLTTIHLYYSFLYDDAKETAIKGGSISEGLVGKIPSLNPLKNQNISDKYINSIIYRSLLKYDTKENKLISDLASCDTKNLLHIKCVLNPNIKWSNGEDILKEDVIQTYKILKESKVNKKMYSLLKNVKIQKTTEGISFINTSKNIQSLKIFFQPIVSHKVLNLISKRELEGNFQLNNGIYSGLYIIKNIISDQNTNISTIVLVKNKEYFNNPVYIDTILFKFFPDLDSFIKNKDSINIFNDTNNLLGKGFSRFKVNEYTMPQFVNLFVNVNKIENNKLRKFILDEVDKDELVELLGNNKDKKYKVKKITDPYFSDIYIKENNLETNLKSELKKEGYFLKKDLLEKYSKLLKIDELILKTNISGEAIINKISSEVKINEKKVNKKEFKEVLVKNSKSKVIYSPNWVDKYNFVSRNDYRLKGAVKKFTTKVFINNYELKGFKSYSKNFIYRISEKLGNLNKGENKYKIYFEINGKKELVDEINFYYSLDKNILKNEEKKLFSKKIKTEIKNEERKIKLNDKKSINKLSITEKEKVEKNLLEIKQKILKINKLSEIKYYSENDFKEYSLELYYTLGKGFYKKTAEYIKNKLNKKGIKVEIRELKAIDLDKLLNEGKDGYDLLLVGMHLSYFNFDISNYYHPKRLSFKTKQWISNPYNLSNYNGIDIEIPLEELKEGFYKKEIQKQLEKKVLKIIKKNNLSKTLYTPILYNLVDKNIKGFNLNNKIPEDIYRFDGLVKSYVLKKKLKNNSNKSIKDYIIFLYNTLLK